MKSKWIALAVSVLAGGIFYNCLAQGKEDLGRSGTYEVIVINDTACQLCSTKFTIDKFSEDFDNKLNFTVLDYQSPKAKGYIEKYRITTLPCFIFPAAVKGEKGFAKYAKSFEDKDGGFLLAKEFSGICYFLDRRPQTGRVDYFFSLHDLGAREQLTFLADFCRDKKIGLNVWLVEDVMSSREETNAVLAVKELYPDRFIDYLSRRQELVASGSWQTALRDLKLSEADVRVLVSSGKIKRLREENTRKLSELDVWDSGVIVINNRRIFKVESLDRAVLEDLCNEK